MKNSTILSSHANTNQSSQYRKVEKRSGKRIGYNYIILKSLKESKKNDVVKCLYIKSLTDFGFCIIKEGTYGDSKDRHGRDIKDRLTWQKKLHEMLQNDVRIPKLLGSFEENGNYYLVIEYIKGKPLYKLLRDKGKELREALINGNKTGLTFLNYLLKIIDILNSLHQHQVVHRDATPNNFLITPKGEAVLIDMELSYSIREQLPCPAFQLGTHGYMSPQQIATNLPTIQEDTFAVGAILLELWTGISASKLSTPPIDALAEKVYFLVPDKQFAEIIIQCLDIQLENRPSLKNVAEVVKNYKIDLQSKRKRSTSVAINFSKEEILEIAQTAVNAICSPLMADKEKGWFSENKKIPAHLDKNKINKTWYASFHLGVTGVMYTISYAHLLGIDISDALPHIEKSLRLVEEKYIKDNDKYQPGLHFGSDGIAASLATSIRNGLLVHKDKYQSWINRLFEPASSSLGVTRGQSGQGLAGLICLPTIHTATINYRIKHSFSCLLEQQKKDGSWLHPTSNTKSVLPGFAHGVSGIVYFLLEYGQYYDDKRALIAAERGIHWLIKRSKTMVSSVQWYSSKNKPLLPWWRDGAPGIALTLIKAYSIFNESHYKEYAEKALRNHPVNVIDNNLSQYRGLSGLGEIYLEAYKVFRDDEWLNRASWIAQVVLHLKKQHPQYGTYWLVEAERQPVAGFMLGNSGILHFLLRYCYPDTLNFPLTPRLEQIKNIEPNNFHLAQKFDIGSGI